MKSFNELLQEHLQKGAKHEHEQSSTQVFTSTNSIRGGNDRNNQHYRETQGRSTSIGNNRRGNTTSYYASTAAILNQRSRSSRAISTERSNADRRNLAIQEIHSAQTQLNDSELSTFEEINRKSEAFQAVVQNFQTQKGLEVYNNIAKELSTPHTKPILDTNITPNSNDLALQADKQQHAISQHNALSKPTSSDYFINKFQDFIAKRNQSPKHSHDIKLNKER